MAKFTKKDIEVLFTEEVAKLIRLGFTFSTTMNDHQGEEMKCDLTNGKVVYRVLLERYNDWETFTEGLVLKVIKYTELNRTLWNNEGEVEVEHKFNLVGSKRYDNNNLYTDSQDDIEEMKQKRHDRAKAQYIGVDNVKRTDDKTKKIVLSWVRRQPGCKTKTIKDINYVVKRRSDDNSYLISVKSGSENKTLILR